MLRLRCLCLLRWWCPLRWCRCLAAELLVVPPDRFVPLDLGADGIDDIRLVPKLSLGVASGPVLLLNKSSSAWFLNDRDSLRYHDAMGFFVRPLAGSMVAEFEDSCDEGSVLTRFSFLGSDSMDLAFWGLRKTLGWSLYSGGFSWSRVGSSGWSMFCK